MTASATASVNANCDGVPATQNIGLATLQHHLLSTVPNCDMEDNETRGGDHNAVNDEEDKSERTFVGGVSICTQWQGRQGQVIVLRYTQCSDPATLQGRLDTICAQ